jgi:integrase
MGVRVRRWKGQRAVYGVFVDHRGRRTAKKVGDKRAAEAVASRIREALAKEAFRLPDDLPPAMTFRALAEEWLVKYPALHAIRPGTIDTYRSFVERHLIPFFGAMALSAITPAVIEDFIEAKRAPGGSVRFGSKALTDASLRTGLLPLRLILARAVRMKRIASNPMHEVEWRGLPHVEQVDPFTGEELRAILAAAGHLDPDSATLFRLWAPAGMRAGEVAGLQEQDLDLERGTALVRRTWSRQRLGPTKTGGERMVSILHPVADDTLEWQPGATAEARSVVVGLRQRRRRSLDNPEAFVFGQGVRAVSSMEVHRVWRRVLRTARVRYRPPEQLRHTFACTMLSRNAPLLYVQQQGGWRSASVLLRVYARWMPQVIGPEIAKAQPPATQAQLGARSSRPAESQKRAQLLDNAESLGLDTERDVKLGPEVLERDGRRQLDDLRLREVAAEAGEELVVNLLAGDRHPLGVLERRPFRRREQRAFPPARHLPDPVLGRPRLHPPGCVDVDSERAAVDESDSQVDEGQECCRELPGLFERNGQLLRRFEDGWAVGEHLGGVQEAAEYLALPGEHLPEGGLTAVVLDFLHARHADSPLSGSEARR